MRRDRHGHGPDAPAAASAGADAARGTAARAGTAPRSSARITAMPGGTSPRSSPSAPMSSARTTRRTDAAYRARPCSGCVAPAHQRDADPREDGEQGRGPPAGHLLRPRHAGALEPGQHVRRHHPEQGQRPGHVDAHHPARRHPRQRVGQVGCLVRGAVSDGLPCAHPASPGRRVLALNAATHPGRVSRPGAARRLRRVLWCRRLRRRRRRGAEGQEHQG